MPFLLMITSGKKMEVANVLLNPATLLKVTLLHECFSRFLNCTNGTKSRNASHL